MSKKKLMYIAWPPAESAAANKAILERRKRVGTESLWKDIQDRVESALQETKELEPLVQLSEKYFESENKRRETIENKAATIVQLVSFVTGILAIGTALLAKNLGISNFLLVAIAFLYLFSVLHLFISVYYAFRVRLLRDLALPSAEAFVDLVTEIQGSDCKRLIIRQRIAEMKWNEDALTMKNNDLVTAERLFQRGLAVFASTVLIVIITKTVFL